MNKNRKAIILTVGLIAICSVITILVIISRSNATNIDTENAGRETQATPDNDPKSEAEAIMAGYDDFVDEYRAAVEQCDAGTRPDYARLDELIESLEARTAELEAEQGSEAVAEVKEHRQDTENKLKKIGEPTDPHCGAKHLVGQYHTYYPDNEPHKVVRDDEGRIVWEPVYEGGEISGYHTHYYFGQDTLKSSTYCFNPGGYLRTIAFYDYDRDDNLVKEEVVLTGSGSHRKVLIERRYDPDLEVVKEPAGCITDPEVWCDSQGSACLNLPVSSAAGQRSGILDRSHPPNRPSTSPP